MLDYRSVSKSDNKMYLNLTIRFKCDGENQWLKDETSFLMQAAAQLADKFQRKVRI